jgi:hypothetical protein
MPTDVTSDAAVSAPARAAEDAGGLGWTFGVIATITVLLALFSAQSMKSWAETLAPTPTNLQIRQAAEGWFDFTDHIGLAAPRAGLRSAWQQVREAKFPEPPGASGDNALQR